MPSLTQLNALQLLVLAPLLAQAQQQPAPPFQLDERGEAHFNIPVVVKLAQPGGVHRRDEDSALVDSNDDAPVADQAVAAPAGVTQLAAPVYQDVEPRFEVTHQGLDSEDEADIEKRAAIPDQAIATHTILLVETTGIATSTKGDASAANTTTGDALGKLPPPMNHTSFPLRNGTNSTLPCNGTEGVVVKPTGTGTKGTATAPVYNPANVGGTKGPGIKGAAASLRAGSTISMVALAVVAAAAGLC